MMHLARLQTPLCRRLGLEWPLIQAPLGGGPSTPELTAAASNAGTLGSLAGAYLSPEALQLEIERTRSLTSCPFAVNLFAPSPEPVLTSEQVQNTLRVTRPFRAELGLSDPSVKPPFHECFRDQFEVVLQAKPAVFSFVLGSLDRDLMSECRRRGILTMGAVTSLDEGIALEELGVDVVVAQGFEAGGHRAIFSSQQRDPMIGTFALTRQLSAKLKVPVVASGGIMDGQGIAAALVLGAQAAQLGTAFLLCDEAGTSAPYRKALLDSRSALTRTTRAFSGRWARGIENRFMTAMESQESAILPFPAQNSFTRDIRKAASNQGKTDYLSLWAGQGLSLIREMSAADLIQSLLDETVAALALE